MMYLVLTFIVGAAAYVYMIFVKGYEQDRINVWLDPIKAFAANSDEAWQIVQSLFAIGSGGLMGQGLGNSRQKHLFLPEPHNDFIFFGCMRGARICRRGAGDCSVRAACGGALPSV